MVNKKISGCIFDLDGTLLHTLGNIHAAVNKTREAMGLGPLPNDDVFASYLGHGGRTLLNSAFGHELSDEEFSVIGPHYTNAYASDLVSLTKPYDGIPQLLSDLVEKGIKVAIISNKRDCFTLPIADHFFSHIPFTFVMGERPDFPLKPNPASALHIASLMGLDPSEVAFVGDSFQDALTANNAGMIACSVLWGYQKKSEISSKSRPDVYFNNVSELSAFLLSEK